MRIAKELFGHQVKVAVARMDHQRFRVVWAVGITQANDLGRFSGEWLTFGALLIAGRNCRFRHTVNNDLGATLAVITDVADVKIFFGRVGAWPRGDCFPVSRFRAAYFPDASAHSTFVEGIKKWSISRIVMRPIQSGRRPGSDDAAAFLYGRVFEAGDLFRITIVAGI